MKKNTIDDEFPRRVASARAARDLTQSGLADLVGISQRQIAAYEAGESKPRSGVLLKLAKALDVTVEWLSSGFNWPAASGDEEIKTIGSSAYVPVITMGMVGDWLSTGGEPDQITSIHHITSTLVSPKSFAVIIRDDAMAHAELAGFGFPKGCIVTFDPAIVAEDKDFVIALFGDGKATFRQYLTGLFESVLAPLDQRYPSQTVYNGEVDGNDITLISAVHVSYDLPAITRCKALREMSGYDD